MSFKEKAIQKSIIHIGGVDLTFNSSLNPTMTLKYQDVLHKAAWAGVPPNQSDMQSCLTIFGLEITKQGEGVNFCYSRHAPSPSIIFSIQNTVNYQLLLTCLHNYSLLDISIHTVIQLCNDGTQYIVAFGIMPYFVILLYHLLSAAPKQKQVISGWLL